VHNYTT